MFDFIIIGGGILGMSTAMQLAERFPDRKLLLLEKEDGPARHQSGHNSGVIHAGVYYTPGSLKARFCLEGNRATKAFCNAHDIPFDECGKLLVATNELEMRRMGALWERTAANGLEREWLDSEALREREPNIKGLGAIFVPSTGIVDYARVTQAMADECERRGAQLSFGHRVKAIDERYGEVVVKTSQGDFSGRYLISCAGLMADRVVKMLGRDPGFTICPFRGEYYRLPEQHNHIVNHLIYPIPDPGMPFLGVHLTRMIDGSVTVGPNAVLALKREGYRKTDVSLSDMARMFTNPGILKALTSHLKPGLTEMRNSLFKSGYLEQVRKYCPSLTLEDLGDYPAGVRAQAVGRDGRLVDDFLFVNTRRTVNVCNAPSPAATSAIPIGGHIVAKVAEQVEW
ncbi:L-2-hydroxyglutarate oxidase [Halomonas urumqiensis]|uniref:L-2-hydroxyglutarate oxidase n=1 Tax=Halomonas urumqiensis TaxID=1684789 RepID=A0A2N7ULU4_9GAMM|nr:L-2-hydroxyglutarate oxidase [Halomonas urumqiensis]PMR81402.1 L-2-hydroxyglutarate oxidase [Halomonas urumqiensis]PTB01202.1 L-2-hydroxyglutarate oxidase [Halomonas urumqiensis]GHE22779.1 L-2-hydroxyglutarate oxidase LhgO [Halomonas urumqiensis]